jgi:hypothetical protein
MSNRLNMMCLFDEKTRKIKKQDGKEIATRPSLMARLSQVLSGVAADCCAMKVTFNWLKQYVDFIGRPKNWRSA